jgi:hypothetical protein
MITSCNSQKHSDIESLKNGETYTVWSTLHLILLDDTEKDELEINKELIQSLPQPVKAIIVRYAALIPDYILLEQESALAQALGGFATLKEAQETLLKTWNSDELTILSGYPAVLQCRETADALFFEHKSMYGRESITDKFQIDRAGHITCFKQPEPVEYIPYSRKTLMDNYSWYRFMLNGEPTDFFYLFLDGDNVKSVGVNNRDQIVYIVQKDKNPKYLVRSDLNRHLDALPSYKVKSIDEIDLILIEDESTKGFHREFYEEDKIESSAIEGLGTYIDDEDDYNVKCLIVKLKK